MRRIAGKKSSIAIAAFAVLWIVGTWVGVPGWSGPLNEGGRFPHAIQVFWTAFGVFFLWLALVAYRHKDDENDSGR